MPPAQQYLPIADSEDEITAAAPSRRRRGLAAAVTVSLVIASAALVGSSPAGARLWSDLRAATDDGTGDGDDDGAGATPVGPCPPNSGGSQCQPGLATKTRQLDKPGGAAAPGGYNTLAASGNDSPEGAAAKATVAGAAHELAYQQAVAAASSTAGYSYSYLYDCDNGRPAVPAEYSDGSWGTIEGDWYVIAANIGRSNPSSGDCCRMVFNFPDVADDDFPDASAMNQHMMYTRGDVEYYWNYTGNAEYNDETGIWVNTGESMYSQFWSGVFLVGTYGDARYFGWYFCGPAVSVTQRGIPWILTDDSSLQSNATFTAMIEQELHDLGVLKTGNFTTYVQDSSCDYTWHHTGNEIE